ncbi:digestive cysteine proteinase 1-like [Tubulanus polymorphus]|uniref:digestive cysteine proteinase 1-like n=1 Tax=Tubulanus polymorphus TaxID=672921 RepID=UPI003DA42A9F
MNLMIVVYLVSSTVISVAFGLYPNIKLSHDENELNNQWNLFKKTYNKTYHSEAEEKLRALIWLKTVKEVETHNMKADLGEFSYWMGINHLSDLTMDEVNKYYKGYGGFKGSIEPNPNHRYTYSDNDIPSSLDWRTKGYVTPVKNQGSCGSCWAFSAIGALEGQQFKRTGKLVSLSEQNLVDCSYGRGNAGCNGGWPYYGYTYARLSRGVDTETSYPYTARNDKCRFRSSTIGSVVYGFDSVPSGSEYDLKYATAQSGPMSVCIDANHTEFRNYRSGVLDIPTCKSDQSDHCVLVIGYGTENGKDYWLVKNSWGPNWGNNGFLKMSRNKNNQCGIATDASWPLV